MRSTGIVRRVDDLNRIVLPKQICLPLGIKVGSAMEILVSDLGEIVLRDVTIENEPEGDDINEEDTKIEENAKTDEAKVTLGQAILDARGYNS